MLEGAFRFGSTYEGLKRDLVEPTSSTSLRFGSTYEGLKLKMRQEEDGWWTGFGSTYEGLKPGLRGRVPAAYRFWQYL